MNLQSEDRIAAQADACRILNACVHLPTPELVQSIADRSLDESIRALLPHLAGENETARRVEQRLAACRAAGTSSLSSLRHEYTRLFAHPVSPLIPVCESLFKSMQRGETEKPLLVVNRIAMALDDEYETAGYERTRGGVTPADHMGTELEFLARLLEERPDEARAFADRHLGTWAPAFFALVEQRAETPEYALFGSLGIACFSA